MLTIDGISSLQQETNGHRYILMSVAEVDTLVHITNDAVLFLAIMQSKYRSE